METPFNILRPFLGARIIKTGLAVFLSLVAFHWVGPQYATSAAVAAILAVQPSVRRARTIFGQQLLGNLVGGTVAAVLGLWLGNSPLGMALGVVVTLGICSQFRLTEAAGLSVFAVLYIMDRPEQDFLLYTGARVAVVAAGMLIGYLVNRFVKPPDFSVQVRDEIRSAQRAVASFGEHLLASLAAPDHFEKEEVKAEIAEIRRHLESARSYLDLYQESNPAGETLLALDRARSALNVHMERMSDIHRIALQAGGLRPGPELGAVAAVLKALDRYRNAVLTAALTGAPVDTAAADECRREAAALNALVDRLVDQRGERERGLVLHSILTNLQHMAWRLDTLTELLQAAHPEADL